MRSLLPRFAVIVLPLLGSADLPSSGDADVAATPAPPAPWSVLRRSICEGKDVNRYWQVDYTLRNDGLAPIPLDPRDLTVDVEGWVSNSRVASHAAPKMSRMSISGTSGLTAVSEVIASSDECRRCRERAAIEVWPAALGAHPPEPESQAKSKTKIKTASQTNKTDVTLVAVAAAAPTILTIPPGEMVKVRLKLEHDHFLYGPHDPLLGPRKLVLGIGAWRHADTVPLDHAGPLPRKASTRDWPSPEDPAADRLDRQVFLSAPSSLHLQAHLPGEQSFRFNDCPVKYSTRMRLKFAYLIAPGTEGECKARVVQSKDAPTAWKILTDGEVEQVLPTVGRWVKFEKIFRTEAEATSVTLEFKVTGEIGEMWIDDVSLEPADEEAVGP